MQNILKLSLLLIIIIGCNTESEITKEFMSNELIITGDLDNVSIQNQEVIVLNQFYRAFNNGDLKLMQDNWLNSKEASMNNPLGGIMRGWTAISNVYERIFLGKAQVYVEFYDFTIHKTEDMFFATGRERGYFKTDEVEMQLAIRTSRIFKKIDGVWKQIQHHGSIDDPELLKKYQVLVSK